MEKVIDKTTPFYRHILEQRLREVKAKMTHDFIRSIFFKGNRAVSVDVKLSAVAVVAKKICRL